jgi:hypothetical protein
MTTNATTNGWVRWEDKMNGVVVWRKGTLSLVECRNLYSIEVNNRRVNGDAASTLGAMRAHQEMEMEYWDAVEAGGKR